MKKPIDNVLATSYNVARTGGDDLSPESRAEYFRKRRESIGQLNVSVPKDKLEALEKRLKEQGQTKTQWVNQKIDEELGKEK